MEIHGERAIYDLKIFPVIGFGLCLLFLDLQSPDTNLQGVSVHT